MTNPATVPSLKAEAISNQREIAALVDQLQVLKARRHQIALDLGWAEYQVQQDRATAQQAAEKRAFHSPE